MNEDATKQINCPRCGALNAPDAPYCLICGAVLGSYATMAPAAPPAGFAAPTISGPPAPVVPLIPPLVPPAAPPLARRGRNGPLIVVLLGVLGLCLFGLVGVGMLGLAGAGALPFLTAPTPTPVDPMTVLAQADTTMNDIKTLHYVMTATLPGAAGGATTSMVRLAGDVVRPDRYTMQANEIGALVVISGDAYLQATPQSPWIRRAAADASPGLAPTNPTVLLRFIHFARDPVAEPDVVSGTLRLRHINFPLDIARMISEEGDQSSGGALAGSRVTCDVLIGVVDHRLYALDLELVQSGNSGPTAATIESRFSNFDAPITIDPPPDAQP